jgi:PBP1b-binding outer membrane lipoprotein LpoB
VKGDKYMKLIMAITLSLCLVGCLSSQGQSPDSKVSNQEVHKQVESKETHATSLREREDAPVKSVLNSNASFSFA